MSIPNLKWEKTPDWMRFWLRKPRWRIYYPPEFEIGGGGWYYMREVNITIGRSKSWQKVMK